MAPRRHSRALSHDDRKGQNVTKLQALKQAVADAHAAFFACVTADSRDAYRAAERALSDYQAERRAALLPCDSKTYAAGRVPGDTNDCGVRAVAVACAVDYHAAHAALEALGRKRRKGTHWGAMLKAARALAGTEPALLAGTEPTRHGWHPMRVTLSRFVRDNPRGSFVLWTISHAFAVVDGVVYDWRARGRCIVRGGFRVA